MIDIVLGLQFGDEGKGRIIDLLSSDYNIVARFNGGSNAGHTVKIKDKTYIFHLLPSGILHEGVIGLIGNGVVVDPYQLLIELKKIRSLGFNPCLYISDRAHLVLPYHKVIDEVEEQMRLKKIGTTKRGIGPTYEDKVNRSGITVGLIKKPVELMEIVEVRVSEANELLKYLGKPLINSKEIVSDLLKMAEELSDMVIDSTAFIKEAMRQKKKILLEGAQGALLDLDFGTYPFISSSNTMSGGAITGTGLPIKSINRIIGVFKAYISRVGEGPLPTELTNETGEFLRNKGKEFGATTGRPRRCGWFDGILAEYATFISGSTEIILTKLDVLSGLKEIKVATSYNLDGKIVYNPPSLASDLFRVIPNYETLPGWDENLEDCNSFNDLPVQAKNYISCLEDIIKVPIKAISVGPERSQFIIR